MSSMSAGSARTTWIATVSAPRTSRNSSRCMRLAGRLEQVRGDRQPPLARQPDQHPVVVERHGERRVRRHARAHEVGGRERVDPRLGAGAQVGPVAEPLDVDDRAQAGLGRGVGDRPRVAAVGDRRHARAEAGGRARAGLLERVVGPGGGLAPDVVLDPRPERHPVAEPAHRRVLEVRVGVHEARQDHRALEPLAGVAGRGPDLGDRPARRCARPRHGSAGRPSGRPSRPSGSQRLGCRVGCRIGLRLDRAHQEVAQPVEHEHRDELGHHRHRIRSREAGR